MSEIKLEDIVSLAKRRGFIYQGSEIYGGLAGTYDYGPLGTQLKRNIVNAWLKYFVDGWDDMYQVDSAILMNPKVWQASGHTETFNDPMVECQNCHARLRVDQIEADKCPVCGKVGEFGKPQEFNMMFRTFIGPTWATAEHDLSKKIAAKTIQWLDEKGEVVDGFDIKDSTTADSLAVYEKDSIAYLRPETAQGMFTNFKNIVDSFSPDLPFGIAQVGKAFRNEISPRDFLFRTREFEIAEFEFFINPADWEKYFEKWRKDMHAWFKLLGLPADKIHEVEVPAEDRAHYSKRTIDFEFDYPFGKKEIAGLAYRTDFDLTNHQKESTKNMQYVPKDGSAPFIPHVIEPTFGIDRHLLAVLANAYTVDTQNGEDRVFLKLPADLAPVKVVVSPLVKNKPELTAKAREVYAMLKKQLAEMPGLRSLGEVAWIDTGNVGKNYRRADEIGVPHCITVDFQTLEDDTVTIRHRDTTEQTRVAVTDLLKSVK